MARLKKTRSFISHYWQPILFWVLGLGLLFGVLFYRLGSLTPQLSGPEVSYHSQASNFEQIVNNPLNAPYKVLHISANELGRSGAFSLRTVSAIYGLITVLLFYYLTSRWHDKKTAIWGTLLFMTSAWFLHYTRIALPSISGTLILASLAYGHWIRKTKRSAFVAILGIFLAAWLIYIPGLIWFVIIGGIWQSKQIGEHLKDAKLSIPIVIALGVGLLAPLAIAITRQPTLLKNLAGLPPNMPNLYDYFRHLVNVPVQIFVHGPNDPVLWLGRLPLLDIFTLTMFIIGVYTYWQRRQLDRTKILGGTLIVGSFIIALRGTLSIVALVPAIYLIVTAGVGYLAKQWLRVYPRNPLARAIGMILISIIVGLACIYNLQQYFVAWSQAPATKKAYQQRL